MPVYEYACEHCGDFTAMRSIAERDQLQACPACDAPAVRVFLTAPAAYLGDTQTRKARARNERAAHEPRRRAVRDAAPAREQAAKPQLKQADCGRPWMIGH